jgi:hypothetical protein
MSGLRGLVSQMTLPEPGLFRTLEVFASGILQTTPPLGNAINGENKPCYRTDTAGCRN